MSKRPFGLAVAQMGPVQPQESRGQIEAARSTGLSNWQALWHVQIPQAARNVMPDLISNTLEVVKLTTLASAVALPELLRVARVLSRLEHRQLSSR